jgi:hypothetical protein
MKNIDVDDIRPREVIELEDDKDQVLSNSNVQASSSHDQNQSSISGTQVQDQQQVASSSSQPNKIDEALKNVDWVNAMHEELNNFTRNQVSELVERPKDHNMIGTKWVF